MREPLLVVAAVVTAVASGAACYATLSQVKDRLQLANQTMALVDALTERITTPFMSPELVGRLADLLLFVVRSLAGKAAAKAKVDNMEK